MIRLARVCRFGAETWPERYTASVTPVSHRAPLGAATHLRSVVGFVGSLQV